MMYSFGATPPEVVKDVYSEDAERVTRGYELRLNDADFVTLAVAVRGRWMLRGAGPTALPELVARGWRERRMTGELRERFVVRLAVDELTELLAALLWLAGECHAESENAARFRGDLLSTLGIMEV